MIPLDRDTLTSLAGLEILALAGILLPLFVGHFLHPAAGLVLALVWWATPGAPVQILHDFRRGWYPFLAAYPWCLYHLFEGLFAGDPLA